LFERVQAIRLICREFGVSLPTAALQYSGRDVAVRSVVVGGSNAEQVTENARRMLEPVPDELWSRLAELDLVPA
jgi:D-threo-aldose 1-dehydrogenase